jgi:hypothetical protein
VTAGERLDNSASTNGETGRRAADDEAVAAQNGERMREAKLRPTGGASGKFVAVEEKYACGGLRRAREDLDFAVVSEGTGSVRGELKLDINGVSGAECARERQDITALEVACGNAGEVDGETPAGEACCDGVFVGLQAANARTAGVGRNLHFLASMEHAILQRAGDDGAEARDGEDAVNGQARALEIAAAWSGVERGVKRGEEFGQSSASDGGTRNDGGAGQRGGFKAFGDFFTDEREPVVFDKITFGKRDDTGLDAQQIENGEMLVGLGHDAFIGSDDEQGDIYAADPREHVLDEGFVARHVYDAGFASAGEGEPGEAEVNGHTTGFFFGEAVGVNAGEGGDEGGFAVVHMPSGADATHE